ncbi:MAG TPA: DnaJ domain-containing protein [Candidatus Saccharimonadales bacterium]|nr:DnaJ domain-containing protein [Candidatus Saccharimonadales bacterium]
MATSSGSEFVDYYELLGVEPSADLPDIRRAFIGKAKEHHPDAGGSADVMRQLNVAYKTLMSETSKAAYDLLHSFHIGSTEPSDYKYHGGREVNDVDDMTDDEIDSFLDDLWSEYRNGPSKPKPSIKQRFTSLFD